MKRRIFPNCPNKECQNHEKPKSRLWYWKKGRFVTKWNSQPVPRYQCKLCKHTFSSHTFRTTYRQKKPYINESVALILTESSTVRGTARILHVSKNTILHRIAFLGQVAKTVCEQKRKKPGSKTNYVQFDELQTSFRTLCLPLTIAFAVRPKTGDIISAQVGTIPCGNALSDLSIRRYGRRKNQKKKTVKAMLRDIKDVVKDEENFTIASDKYLKYKEWIEAELPFAKHQSHSGDDLKKKERYLANVDGHGPLREFSELPNPETWWKKKLKNGEIKTKAYDPLFHINQKCAVLRSRISRLRKKFWGFTQKVENLQHMLWIFIAVHNRYAFPDVVGGSYLRFPNPRPVPPRLDISTNKNKKKTSSSSDGQLNEKDNDEELDENFDQDDEANDFEGSEGSGGDGGDYNWD